MGDVEQLRATRLGLRAFVYIDWGHPLASCNMLGNTILSVHRELSYVAAWPWQRTWVNDTKNGHSCGYSVTVLLHHLALVWPMHGYR